MLSNHLLSRGLSFLRGVFLMCAVLAAVTRVEAVDSPITVTTLRVNNGEFITRSRTVTLTIAAKSTQGSIRTMQLGDSVSKKFGAPQAYKSSVVYAFPATASGRQFIAAVFQDSRGTFSGEFDVWVDIMPDLPALPALVKGPTPTMSLRRGAWSSTRLVPLTPIPSDPPLPPDPPIIPTVVDPGNPIVQLSTARGELLVQLYPLKAPNTVANFLKYVDSDAYDYSFFHRSVHDFIIQAGGSFVNTSQQNSSTIESITSFGTVQNEPNDSNTRGTIAMAKVDGDPDSATSEWFFNLGDNSANLDQQNGGFTVFGKVLDPSMEVVDGIAALPISDQSTTLGFGELPVFKKPAEGQSLMLQDLVLIYSASRYRFSVIKPLTGVKASIYKSVLVLEPDGRPTGTSGSITIRAATPDGRTLDFPVLVDVGTNHPMLANGVGTKAVTVTEDKPMDISVPVNNPDNSPLAWAVSPEPTKGVIERLTDARSGTIVFRYTPNRNAVGTDTLTIWVRDDNVDPQKKGEDKLAVQVQIRPVNDLPVVTAAPTVSMVGGVDTLFDFTVEDVETPADSLTVTCALAGVAFPRGSVTIEGTGASRKVRMHPSVVTKATTATMTLTVTDGNRSRGTARVAVTVNPRV